MKKKTVIIVLLILVASLLIFTAVSAATKLARLTVINKTNQDVALSLVGEETFYYLAIAPGKTKVFTVERDVYDHRTWACDLMSSGTVDLSTNLRLVFTACASDAPNQGEPTMEKVHIDDSPEGPGYRYQH